MFKACFTKRTNIAVCEDPEKLINLKKITARSGKSLKLIKLLEMSADAFLKNNIRS